MSSLTDMLTVTPSSIVNVVRGMPMLKDPLSFFQYKQDSRLFVTITDSIKTWQNDLIIAERLFADMVVCPFGIESTLQAETVIQTRDILKQRMKYPGIKEHPELETIAKTWVLPAKLHSGSDAIQFIHHDENAIFNTMQPIFQALNKDKSQTIHMLKIELANGVERQMIYKFLDSGFRPSILLIKWSHDIDDHIGTAHCAGHVSNSGYSMYAYENGYSLYIFTDQTLYDICSMKVLGFTNPIMTSIIQGVKFETKPNEPSKVSQEYMGTVKSNQTESSTT